MKNLLCFTVFAFSLPGYAQVGIGTTTPEKMLSINGTMVVDADHANFGTLDSAALLFGNNTPVGIINKSNGTNNTNGLGFYTNDSSRMLINKSGNVGIGEINPTYRLHVSGSLAAHDSFTIDQNLIGYGNLNVDSAAIVDNSVGIGMLANSLYKLQVNGITRISDDLYIHDNALVDGEVKVGNKAVVKTNSVASLRMGFFTKSIDEFIGPNASQTIYCGIPNISGNDQNFKVSIAQCDWGNNNETKVVINIAGVSPTGLCIIKIYNPGSYGIMVNCVLHLLYVYTE